MNIDDFLYDLYDELVAQGAWSGHCYGFEYLSKEYHVICEFMEANGYDVSCLVKAYEDAKAEHDSIMESKDKNFMNDSDTLDELDICFTNELAWEAQVMLDEYGTETCREEISFNYCRYLQQNLPVRERRNDDEN